ncbi:MAG: ADP-ribosylglycohydrolase family protein [Planctomycetales bacterium]
MSDAWSQLADGSLPAPLTFGAIGDAYGFCFEFADAEFVRRHNDLEYHQHPKFDVRPGNYSDDTQMQLALAELLVSGEEWTPLNIAEAFVQVFKRDPRQGYAKRFRALMEDVRDGAELIERLRPESDRNGAAMRAPVLGMLPKIHDVIEHAAIQAAVTHRTRGGIDSAVAAALLSHYFVYELGPRNQLPEFLDQEVPGYNWSRTWIGKVPVHGISTVRAAVTAITASASLSELLRNCVAFTGDVDSVATVACAGVSSSPGFPRDVPTELWRNLESSRYGRDDLIKTDGKVRAAMTSR